MFKKFATIKNIFNRTQLNDIVKTIGARTVYISENAYYKGRAIAQRMSNKHGYSQDDLWNLGNNEIRRIAKYMQRVANMSYNNVDIKYFQHLMPYANDIINWHEDLETLYDLILVDPLKDKINSAVNERNEHFMNAWRWIGRNMMTEKYIRPICDNANTNTIKIINTAHKIINRATDSVDAIDTDKFPVNECLRIADMLWNFLNSNVGYEEGYSKSNHQLKKRNKEWADNSAGFWYAYARSQNKNGDNDAFVDAGDNMYRLKTNREIGLDYCAYCEDIDYASTIFKLWGNWMLKHPADISASDSVDTIGNKLREEFIRCWDWFGENAMSLWW